MIKILFHYGIRDKNKIENYRVHFPKENNLYRVTDLHTLTPGVNWKREQTTIINAADCVVFFLSPELNLNRENDGSGTFDLGYKIFQLRGDLFKNKQVFIIRIRACDDSNFDPTKYIYLNGGDIPKTKEQIYETVIELKTRIQNNG